jgi:hypothetical protein
MPTTDSPSWWADVQQDRQEIDGNRVVADWLEEDIDFVPRRRFAQGHALAAEGPEQLLHGVFVHAGSMPRATPAATAPAGDAAAQHVPADLAASAGSAARAFAFESRAPAAAEGRRTVQITGRPFEHGGVAPARARRPRTASERVGRRPDRIALWAVLLGVILIIIAFTSSDSQAATHAAAIASALV